METLDGEKYTGRLYNRAGKSNVNGVTFSQKCYEKMIAQLNENELPVLLDNDPEKPVGRTEKESAHITEDGSVFLTMNITDSDVIHQLQTNKVGLGIAAHAELPPDLNKWDKLVTVDAFEKLDNIAVHPIADLDGSRRGETEENTGKDKGKH